MSSAINDIKGIGPGTAKLLMKHGLTTTSKIAGATIEQVCAVPGFGPTRAASVIKAANELLTGSNDKPAAATVVATKATVSPRRITKKPTPKPTTGNTSTNATKPEEKAKISKKEQEKLKKAKKAAAKKAAAKKAKKAAAKKAKKAAAKKAAAKKAAAKKAKKAAAKKAKKAAAKKAKAKKSKSKKSKK
jgi:adenylate kinase